MTPEDRYRYTKGGVKLAILGTFVFGIYLAVNSMGETETAAYRTLDECLKDGKFGPEDCKNSFETARAEHLKNAPSYQNREDCEEEFGNGHCEVTSSVHVAGGGHYSPYQSGYLIGQPETSANGVYYPAVPASALYESSHVSGFVNAAGQLVTNKVGGFKMTYSDGARFSPDVRTTTLARSGFGTRHSSAS